MSSLTTTSSMEESPEEFDTRLSLGIGGGSRTPRRRPPPVRFDELFPPPQALLLEDRHGSRHRDQAPGRKNKGESRGTTAARQHNKRARTTHGGDRGSLSDGGDSGGARKKLLLTREQAALLEDSFRAHNILSHAQKHDLARQLGLSPRQVEVWFQNRRARTKLRQTEVDCELLRRWCQRLSDENVRLRHELAEVRSSAVSRPRAAAVLCPSCDKLALVAGGDMARPS